MWYCRMVKVRQRPVCKFKALELFGGFPGQITLGGLTQRGGQARRQLSLTLPQIFGLSRYTNGSEGLSQEDFQLR